MKVIITESQYKKLFEAQMEGFRLDALNTMPYAKKVRYCKEMLGNPIGNGSSRIVFQIDDEKCLKLAKNQKGVAQNEEECSITRDSYKEQTGLFPKVYQFDGDHIQLFGYDGDEEPRYQWIVCEYVLPAKAQDFKKVTGFDWKLVCNFIMYQGSRYERGIARYDRSVINDNNIDEILEADENGSYFLNELENYLGSYQPPTGDYTRLANWGMVQRDGETHMVILDSGLSEEIYNNFYRRR